MQLNLEYFQVLIVKEFLFRLVPSLFVFYF